MVAEGFKDLKTQIVKWKDEMGEEPTKHLPHPGQTRTEWSFDTEER